MGQTPMIDPRPMEPDWVSDLRPEPSGLLEWSTMRVTWSRELQANEQRIEHHEGTPSQFISYVCGIINSASINNAEITVNAAQSTATESDCMKLYLEAEIPYNFNVDWGLKYNNTDYATDNEETGSDPDELISWLVYVIQNNGRCVIDLQDYDPTPRYS
jgi:hypothetical protein